MARLTHLQVSWKREHCNHNRVAPTFYGQLQVVEKTFPRAAGSNSKQQNTTLLRYLRVWLFMYVFIMLSLSSVSQKVPQQKLDSFFNSLAEKNKAMGSLAVLQRGKVIYTRSIGFSQGNNSGTTPITENTRFRIGSVTKMFTAAIIFQLAEEGRLKLTSNLVAYFPEIPNAERITIKQLLGHRSGIHEMTETPEFKNRRFEPLEKEEMIAMIARTPVDFEPGSNYSYSSSGYYLLGLIIEKITGKTYEQVLRERITNKLKLSNTYVATHGIATSDSESYSYRFTRTWEQQRETHPSILFASGSLISTPADMSSFINSIFQGKLISSESLQQMKQDRLGIDTFFYHGKIAYGQTGGIDGFGSWLVVVPEDQLVVSYATNGKVYPVTKIINGIMDIYRGKPFNIPDFETINISTEVLDSYVGVYTVPGTPLKFTVTRDESTIIVQIPGQSPIALAATSGNTFKIESPEIIFEFDAVNHRMTQRRDGRARVFVKENSATQKNKINKFSEPYFINYI